MPRRRGMRRGTTRTAWQKREPVGFFAGWQRGFMQAVFDCTHACPRPDVGWIIPVGGNRCSPRRALDRESTRRPENVQLPRIGLRARSNWHINRSGVIRPSGPGQRLTNAWNSFDAWRQKNRGHDKHCRVCCNEGQLERAVRAPGSRRSDRRTPFAQTQIYRSRSSGNIETRLWLSSSIGRPALNSVSMPINSLP